MSDKQTIRDLLGEYRILSFDLGEGVPDGDLPTNSNIRWHNIGIEGEWDGHHQGPLKLTRALFDQMVYNASQKEIDTVVDYEHQTLFSIFGADTKAAGWIKKISTRDADDGSAELWALIEWTAPAAKKIRNKEYRYNSPVFRWSTPDRRTGMDIGPSLHSVALTNTPFLHELPEISLNSLLLRPVQQAEGKNMKRIASLLGLAENAEEEQIVAALTERLSVLASAESVLEINPSNASEAKEQIVQLRAKVDAAQQTSLSEVAELRAQVQALHAEKKMDAARRSGKITALNEAVFAKLAVSDPDTFDALLAATEAQIPQRKKPANSVSVNADVDAPITEEEIRARVSAMSETERNVVKSFPSLKPEVWAKQKIKEERAELARNQ